jgi:hypothetical protein
MPQGKGGKPLTTPRRGLPRLLRPLVVLPVAALLVVLAGAVLLLWPASSRSAAMAPSHAGVPAGGSVAVPDTGGGPGLP